MTRYSLRIRDNTHQIERVCIVLPLQVENFLIQRFSDIKVGLEQVLTHIYDYDFWTKIHGLVDLEIFINKNQAIMYAAIHYYVTQNSILGE